jgi:DNA-binding MarR family transcriptional regulator
MWRAGLDRALSHLGLTSAQYGVLSALHGLSAGGTRPSQRELADFVGLEPMFVSKLARTLQQKGLVERRVHPDDPRALQLAVTVDGNRLLTAARKIVIELEERRLAGIGGQRSRRSIEFKETLIVLLKDGVDGR